MDKRPRCNHLVVYPLENCTVCMASEIAALKAEVERLKNLIGIIQRESLNDLDLISKFNAEIAALKAEVERLKKVIKEKYDESAFLESELVEKDVEIAALKAEVERLKALLEAK